MSHEHSWTAVYQTARSIYYECSCGASKLVSKNTKGEG